MDSDQQGLISSPRRASQEDKRWFALRATYNRELMVKDDLEQCGWECFVPMRVVKRERGSIVERRLEPSVHNLLFVHCTERELKEYKRATTMPVRYIMNRVTRRPLVVPDGQMRSFMAVANATEEDVVYLTPKPGDFAAGERVRIIGGVFKGAEGVFVRVKGDRRVVVSIEGVIAVATTFVHPSLLEKITED